VIGKAKARWLSECQSIWMREVEAKASKCLKEAIRKMSSEKFLQNVHAINNERNRVELMLLLEIRDFRNAVRSGIIVKSNLSHGRIC